MEWKGNKGEIEVSTRRVQAPGREVKVVWREGGGKPAACMGVFTGTGRSGAWRSLRIIKIILGCWG